MQGKISCDCAGCYPMVSVKGKWLYLAREGERFLLTDARVPPLEKEECMQLIEDYKNNQRMTIEDFIHGRFKRPLRKEVREIWVKFMYCLIILAGLGVMAIVLQVCSWITRVVNYVAWGITV